VRFEKVKRPQGDLLDHVRQRGKWPSPANRYFISDHKRGQVAKVITRLVAEAKAKCKQGKARVLNCLGRRADESIARANLEPLALDTRLTNGKREVWTCLPIHGWTVGQVWDRIRASGVDYHPAYDLGIPRLSCVFCVFATKAVLLVAGQHNPGLLD
jgi:3'-phosphoadenosine 5'-phosphosulfate sulfotransferase (PAPS reductase)/FAD synthetase